MSLEPSSENHSNVIPHLPPNAICETNLNKMERETNLDPTIFFYTK